MTNDQAINFIHGYCLKSIPTDDPVQTVKQFKEEMYEFYSMNDGARSVVFSYAYEMAEEIYILLLRKALSLKRSMK